MEGERLFYKAGSWRIMMVDASMLLQRREIATLAGGCFWCLEAFFKELRGVEKVVSGYSGGIMPDPSYKEVNTGTTGHAETIQITFDPRIISFKELLEVFFTIQDPTTLNRQGADARVNDFTLELAE